MKCDNCIHLFVCKFNAETVKVTTQGMINPYDFTATDEKARETFNTIFSILDNCKYFKATQGEKA